MRFNLYYLQYDTQFDYSCFFYSCVQQTLRYIIYGRLVWLFICNQFLCYSSNKRFLAFWKNLIWILFIQRRDAVFCYYIFICEHFITIWTVLKENELCFFWWWCWLNKVSSVSCIDETDFFRTSTLWRRKTRNKHWKNSTYH